MAKKYLMFSLDDEKSKAIADILGNKTCKKIIDFLSEKREASEKELADSLKLPINTAEYNLKKLIEVGLIEKTKNFFWSQKGKKILMYKLSNKSILISPKSSSKIETLASIALISGLGAVFIRQLTNLTQSNLVHPEKAASGALYSTADKLMNSPSAFILPSWAWFLIGVAIATLIVMAINWRKL